MLLGAGWNGSCMDGVAVVMVDNEEILVKKSGSEAITKEEDIG